ncbi:MAG TPA: sigma 54-interacting transcriptional regulator, partial [Vicinamibacteria bacterium]|nr:sigma 54-interacting transcriptional regulator [Vicinamibacteria bacterium]
MSTVRVKVEPADFSDLIRFEGYLAKIAPRFQRLSATELDAAIAEAQRGLVEALDVDRTSIIQFSEGGGLFQVTHVHGRNGAPSLEVGIDLAGVFPWYAAEVRKGRRLVYAHLPRGLPREAASEAAYVAQSGMKSHLIIPLDVDKEIVGCLAMATFREYREFSPQFLSRIEVLASIFASALHRSRLEARLRAALETGRATGAPSGAGADADLPVRVRLAAVLAEVAPRFQRLPPQELDQAIRAALAGVLEAMDMDRIAITEFSRSANSYRFSYAHWRPGLPPIEVGVEKAASFPWYAVQVQSGKKLVLSRLPKDLPEEARAEFAPLVSLGMKSLVLLPLDDDREVVGCLAISSFREYREFSSELQARLDLLGSVFASALQRSRFETRLKDARDLSRSIMVSITNPAMVLDRKGRVTAVNEAWMAPSDRPRCTGIRAPMSEGVDPGRTETAEGEGEFPDAVRSVLSGRSAHCEVTLRCKCEESRCSYRVAISPLGAEEGGALVTRTDITELEESRAALEASLEEVRQLKDRLESENAILLQNIPRSTDFGEIVGRTPALSVLLEQVRRVAGTDAPVLVLGETGTGKGLIARAIHDRSPRSARPLITVNCAALPPTLIDSEMFGYEKGAFTGAIARTPGRFEVADRGTLLLDEIGELPLDLQAKLLRVLQTGEFERLGSSKTLRVDVRVIAATNRDLEREVREGRFRADLFYRLSVFPLTLPPLRNRPEDIPLLVWHHIARRQAPLGRRIERVPERVMRAFTAYSWPGNIRELENVIERALILSDGPTLATEPMFLGERLNGDASASGSLAEVERQYIVDVLQQCEWRVAGKGNAADRLGLNRSTLLSRMKKLGITRADFDDSRPNRKEAEPATGRARPLR